MFSVYIDNIGEMAVIECSGRLVRSEAGLKLREALTSQENARIIVLDLSEVPVVGGSGLGMLVFLQHWTLVRHIRLKIFNPRQSVRESLNQVNSMQAFDIATLDEMMALLAGADRQYARAA